MLKAATIVLGVSALLLGPVLAAAGQLQQDVLFAPNLVAHESYDSGLFTGIEDLSTLSEDYFTHFVHPAFPRHSVRVKKTPLCSGETAGTYTGYINIEAKHIFFYFIESRHNPAKDDVILWVEGGPGCSSSAGVFVLSGPCMLGLDKNLTFNPYSWNTNASIIYVDQPVGVGYSYAEHGETVGTTELASKDIAAFLAIFFETFSQYKGRAFHMSGLSYAGRYLPIFAAAVYDQNAILTEAGLTPINLKSVMIGNGCTDWYTMQPSYYDMTCTSAVISPVLDISTCVRMKQAIPRCKKWMKSDCIDTFDRINCEAAMNFCDKELTSYGSLKDKNPYDMTIGCDGLLCYPIMDVLTSYLSEPEVQSVLGADPLSTNFSVCSKEVGSLFAKNLDGYPSIRPYVSSLLEHGVRMLFFAGRHDWICNYIGNERFTMDLDWSGHEEFSSQPLREWSVDGKKAGMTRSAKGLTYVSFDGSGHFVPHDKPKEALELMQRWIWNIDI